MNELKVFNYLNNEVRTIIVNDTVWFVASDIAKILEYRMASDMTRNLDDDEKDTQIVRTLFFGSMYLFINQPQKNQYSQ